MRSAILLALLAALGGAGVAAAQHQPAESDAAAPEQLGGPFILRDHNGRTVTDEDYRGHVLLLTFGYTHCPDVCPATLMTIASAIHELGLKGKRITPIFVSLDPARDDPARLKEYVESFGPGFVGLTGPEANVANLAARYHIRFEKAPGAGGDYAVDHSTGIFVLGPRGGVLTRLPYDAPASRVAEAARAAMTGASLSQ